jgi:hypothetical protein
MGNPRFREKNSRPGSFPRMVKKRHVLDRRILANVRPEDDLIFSSPAASKKFSQ